METLNRIVNEANRQRRGAIMATAQALPEERVTSTPDQRERKGGASEEQRLVLRGIDWSTYRTISEALTECHVQLTFDRGALEFMTKSRLHEIYCRLFAFFVSILAEEWDLPITCCGEMTCDREDLDRGLEPDECFYLINDPLVRDKDEIDLAVDPPPDLAVEVDVSRSSLGRLSIYEALKIPEVWRFDGRVLHAYLRNAEGRYEESPNSFHFPFLLVQEMVPFLQQRSQVRQSQLLKNFRAWVREQIAQYRSTETREQP